MHGLMQDRALSLPMLMDAIENRFGHKRVVTTELEGTTVTTYRQMAQRIRRLAGALDTLEVPPSARVGSFGWNSQRHLELYMAVPCTNRVLHTINHRLFADDIVYLVNDAADDVVFVDRSIFEVVWPLLTAVRPCVTSSSQTTGRRHRCRAIRGSMTTNPWWRQPPPSRRSPSPTSDLRLPCATPRNHWPTEGGSVRPSLGDPACHVTADGGFVRHQRGRYGHPDRSDVPRQRVGIAVRRPDVRSQPGDARSRHGTRQADRRHGRASSHVRRGRPDGLAERGTAPRRCRSRLAAAPRQRRRRATHGPVAHLSEDDRPAPDQFMGNDGDESPGLQYADAERRRGTLRARTPRTVGHPRPPDSVVCTASDRRRRRRGPSRRPVLG